jgi:hypothetical protein
MEHQLSGSIRGPSGVGVCPPLPRCPRAARKVAAPARGAGTASGPPVICEPPGSGIRAFGAHLGDGPMEPPMILPSSRVGVAPKKGLVTGHPQINLLTGGLGKTAKMHKLEQ